MAKKGGAPENLDPVRTKEEAKRRGRNGGIKSGEARRNKRDAKNAMNMLLDMAAKGQIKENIKTMGVGDEDQTNMVALQARLFMMAMSGNLQAYDRILKVSGNDPDENRAERESLASDRRRDAESKARVEAMGKKFEPIEEAFGDEDETEDVVIYMPENGRDKKLGDVTADVRGTETPSDRKETGNSEASTNIDGPEGSEEGGH